jgi:hypothetical protein
MLSVAFLCQGTWALAGTTGGLSGTVTDDNGAAVAGADVKVVSASETASSKTDNSGHFTFLSLAPDTYTVSIEKGGFNPVAYAGVTVFADNQQSLSFKLDKALKEIAKVSARSAGALVKAGTTSDVYSVNASAASKLTGLGGGGGLDNAYSAIASVPGAYVPVGQNGWYQNVYIRGGDYDQVGYEVDGVPVNRSFDNYPSSTASALGQQEVQVYTGASPANAESQGLSGFINQVIKTGTYPGFGTSDIGVGSPTYYHKLNLEVGGASPDRLFSYYAGFGGYNQDYRYYNQGNGASISSLWGTPVDILAAPANCATASNDNCINAGNPAGISVGPGGLLLGPYNYASTAGISDRENVVNFHFGIPHHHDGGRDDLQLLYQTSELMTSYYNSPNDLAGALAQSNALGANGTSPTYVFGHLYTGAVGQPLSPSQYGTSCPVGTPAGKSCLNAGQLVNYGYPSAPATLASGGAIPNTLRDTADNGTAIAKLQYQKNFGSSAYLRVYGYSLYSNWFLYGPNTTYANFVGPNPEDYELFTHTGGLSASFSDQLNAHNLLTVQGSYTQATVIRDNNTTATNGSLHFATLVDSSNPYSGICYSSTHTATACQASEGGSAAYIKLGTANGGAPKTGFTDSSGGTCGAGTCEYLVTDGGAKATYNQVKPKFYSYSITDEYDPSDRLHLNLGLRLDQYQFVPADTTGTLARTFWFNAWNQSMCVNNGAGVFRPVAKTNIALPCSDPTNLGAGATSATLTNTAQTNTFNVFQPRLGATFTVNPTNVLRLSAGKYDQAPNSAFEQYNTQQQDLASFIGFRMYQYGRTQTTYPIRPETSFNYDLSWEHQLKGTAASFKLTPFYRTTKDQIQQFYLDPKTNFVSGLNVGRQTSEGVEFQLQDGDFSRNGFAGLFSYTYTNAKVKYDTLSNGSSILSPINDQISAYNAFTKAGGGAPCYTTAGAADAACAAGSIANPYYNAPKQALLDTGASYAPYDLFPGQVGLGSYGSFVAPHTATLVLNYKRDKFAITPAFQFSSGHKYGYPLATFGIDPSSSCAALAGGPDTARYPYGAAGGSGYDATSCGNLINIPNPDTGTFDSLGALTGPNRLTMNTQLTYEVNPRITAVATLANIFDTCWGGTKGAWTSVPGVPASKVCGYGAAGAVGAIGPVGNVYNPGTAIQPYVAHSYGPTFGSLPFNAYFDLKIKL